MGLYCCVNFLIIEGFLLFGIHFNFIEKWKGIAVRSFVLWGYRFIVHCCSFSRSRKDLRVSGLKLPSTFPQSATKKPVGSIENRWRNYKITHVKALEVVTMEAWSMKNTTCGLGNRNVFLNVSIATIRIDDIQRVSLIKLVMREINISFDRVWRKT